MILGIGTPIEILTAIVIYMFAIVVITELTKKLLKIDGGVALMLSWIVGVVIFIGLAYTKLFAFNFSAVIVFMFITGITNSLYRWEALRDFIRKMLGKDV